VTQSIVSQQLACDVWSCGCSLVSYFGQQVVPVSLMGSKFASRRGSSNGGDQSPGVARSSMPSLPTR
jgi:hypothetical protein